MACHTRPDVRAFFDVINPILGVEFGDKEWHALRNTVEVVSERALSRGHADGVAALTTASRVADTMAFLPEQREILYLSVQEVGDRWVRGTLDCFDFLADFGPIATVDVISRACGAHLVRDFLGRYTTVNGEWLIERSGGSHVGDSANWRVVAVNTPNHISRTFGVFSEAREYVRSQPVSPYPGARRHDVGLGITTTICPLRHIANMRDDAIPEECRVCGTGIQHLPVVYFGTSPSVAAEGIFGEA